MIIFLKTAAKYDQTGLKFSIAIFRNQALLVLDTVKQPAL